jgi:CubicO group peptidase (beta-lactamase class C family)
MTTQGQGLGAGVGGFSGAGLARLAAELKARCDKGELVGAVVLLARWGQVWSEAYGRRSLGDPAPQRPDDLFDIASISKPILAALALMLVEEGRLGLDQSLDRWLPELAGRRVLADWSAPLDDTVPAKRPVMLRDLLTLTSGDGAIMAPDGSYPIQVARRAAGVAPGFARPTLAPDEWLRRLGALPLLAQPGERWLYHTPFDILAVLLARVGGQPLPELLRARLLDPLGMNDTSFDVPPDKLARVARRYRAAADGRLVPETASPPEETGPFPSELYASAPDLLAFGRLLLDEGRCGGRRLLPGARVRDMLSDQIPAAVKAVSPFFPGFWEGRGWGLGLSVVLPGPNSVGPGRAGWDGGYGTSFYVDPGQDLVGVLLIQRAFDAAVWDLHQRFWALAYAALSD